MIGTWLNIATVLIGGGLGLLLGGKLPERIRRTIIAGLGLFTLGYGISLFIKTENALIVLGSLLLGGLLGEWWHFEDGLQRLGAWIERKTQTSQDGDQSARFVRGFLTASLVFCVGPMTILGSIEDGMTGSYSTLAVKSILDGFGALAFASSLGVGVLFSALIILVYQGGLTLLAAQVSAVVSQTMMNEMTAVGGVILMGIAISSLLEIKPIRTANFLPALLLAPLLVWLVAMIR
jgi:uncharacterized membrane protein YqgA involved in biofilm formation